ncbi:MAG: class I SAM-dependent methyltransferase [Deltaproteobacteria bacterium]|nr:class I SAM-dependent methyltransferase [Deltaproteobacteria bacterium]
MCKNSDCRIERELYDDRYGFKGSFRLAKCLKCGHRHLQGEFTPELISRLYSEYYPRSAFKLEEHKPFIEAKGFFAWLKGKNSSAFRWVPKNVRVLDIGCGFGETLGYHKARGCDVYGVEADRNILRVAERFGYKVHAGLFEPDIYEPASFDYVTMDQVLEHTIDPVVALMGVRKVLKEGGVAVLSMPNPDGWGARVFGKRWINWHVPYHIQHFSFESMKILAEKADFKIEKTCTITDSSWLWLQWLHLLTYPKEGEPSEFWASNGRITSGKRKIARVITLFHLTGADHLFTRFFDFLNIGDNYIFVLKKI